MVRVTFAAGLVACEARRVGRKEHISALPAGMASSGMSPGDEDPTWTQLLGVALGCVGRGL